MGEFIIQYWFGDVVGNWCPINSKGIDTIEKAKVIADDVGRAKKTQVRVLEVLYTNEREKMKITESKLAEMTGDKGYIKTLTCWFDSDMYLSVDIFDNGDAAAGLPNGYFTNTRLHLSGHNDGSYTVNVNISSPGIGHFAEAVNSLVSEVKKVVGDQKKF